MDKLRNAAFLVGSCVLLCIAEPALAIGHPGLGRFAQRDPLGYVDGANLYEYVRGNPVNGLDPWGLSDVSGAVQGMRLDQSDHPFAGQFIPRGELDIRIGNTGPGYYSGSLVTVRWRPGKGLKELPDGCCTEVRFIQIIQTLNERDWQPDENSDWHIDAKPNPPWYGTIGDGETNHTPWKAGSILPAEMIDVPGSVNWRSSRIRQEANACAVCAKGPETGAIYGCAYWYHLIEREKGKSGTKWYITRAARIGATFVNTGRQLAWKHSTFLSGDNHSLYISWTQGHAPPSSWVDAVGKRLK